MEYPTDQILHTLEWIQNHQFCNNMLCLRWLQVQSSPQSMLIIIKVEFYESKSNLLPPEFYIYINPCCKSGKQVNCISNVLLLIFNISCIFVLYQSWEIELTDTTIDNLIFPILHFFFFFFYFFIFISIKKKNDKKTRKQNFFFFFLPVKASLLKLIHNKASMFLRYADKIRKQEGITLTLLFESINLSATSESNFSCETSGISGLKFKWFFNKRTLPAKDNTNISTKRGSKSHGY